MQIIKVKEGGIKGRASFSKEFRRRNPLGGRHSKKKKEWYEIREKNGKGGGKRTFRGEYQILPEREGKNFSILTVLFRGGEEGQKGGRRLTITVLHFRGYHFLLPGGG